MCAVYVGGPVGSLAAYGSERGAVGTAKQRTGTENEGRERTYRQCSGTGWRSKVGWQVSGVW